MLRRLALTFLLVAGIAPAAVSFHVDPAAAASTKKKKITHKRSDFTPERRAKMMEEAHKICKKRYGAGARVYRIDYYHWKVWCQEG